VRPRRRVVARPRFGFGFIGLANASPITSRVLLSRRRNRRR
jgi:hypothetical protein